ncbi:MAG: glycosyltransferase [Candidatus Omnitrophica bacterium]|nr:glycosyltransferase [Candidatus Omnitrophota bacterium]
MRKIAIVHDWLTGMRGGEKCLEALLELYPGSTIYTLVHKKGSVAADMEKMDIRTSLLMRIPGIERNYRSFLPFFPWAIESFDLSAYDLVISSSHCAAKGARKKEGALHICYCHTPIRYAWKFFDEYFSRENVLKKQLIKWIVSWMKKWDLKTNEGVDHFIANSNAVKDRIKEYYGRDAAVIYPPVSEPHPQNTMVHGPWSMVPEGSTYYLVVSALVPYKRVDLAVEVFNKNKKELVIVGTGTEYEKLKKKAGGNIHFAGWVNDAELEDYYAGCKALIFPGEEDFGIVPLEAQMRYKPVIAYARGGVLETVIPMGSVQGGNGTSPTGVFFDRDTPESLEEAIALFEKNVSAFDPEGLRNNALSFGRERFKREMREYIEAKWEEHVNACGS